MAGQKTAGTRMVEAIIGSMLNSVIENTQPNNPMPPLSEDGEPITAQTMIRQLERTCTSEPRTAMRIALVLGAYLARQEGITEKDALMSAACAWAQTSNLTSC